MLSMRTKSISRKLKVMKLFEKWKNKARPMLINVLSEDREKIDGLEFMTNVPGCGFAYTSGTNINKILVGDNGKYKIESRDRDYQDERHIEEIQYTAEDLASKMLRGLVSLYQNSLLNQRRNILVRDIENLTGINIKKEIQTSHSN